LIREVLRFASRFVRVRTGQRDAFAHVMCRSSLIFIKTGTRRLRSRPTRPPGRSTTREFRFSPLHIA